MELSCTSRSSEAQLSTVFFTRALALQQAATARVVFSVCLSDLEDGSGPVFCDRFLNVGGMAMEVAQTGFPAEEVR